MRRTGIEIGTPIRCDQVDLPARTLLHLRPGKWMLAQAGRLETEWEHGYFCWARLRLQLKAADADCLVPPGAAPFDPSLLVEATMELDFERVEQDCGSALQAGNLEELLAAVGPQGFPLLLDLGYYLPGTFQQARSLLPV